MNLENGTLEETVKSPSFDIGEIMVDSDDKIYYMESSFSSTEKDKSLYRIGKSIFKRKKIVELNEKEILIGIY